MYKIKIFVRVILCLCWHLALPYDNNLLEWNGILFFFLEKRMLGVKCGPSTRLSQNIYILHVIYFPALFIYYVIHDSNEMSWCKVTSHTIYGTFSYCLHNSSYWWKLKRLSCGDMIFTGIHTLWNYWKWWCKIFSSILENSHNNFYALHMCIVSDAIKVKTEPCLGIFISHFTCTTHFISFILM